MKYEFQNLQDALACLLENYPYVILGQTIENDQCEKFNDIITPILGGDAFQLLFDTYGVDDSLKWGWMWNEDHGAGGQFIVGFNNANSFVLARLAGAFDGIAIKEFK